MKEETLDGYKLRWCEKGDIGLAKTLLRENKLDGVGINPYNGWTGSPADIFEFPESCRALAVPCADKIGFTSEHYARFARLEWLLISDCSLPLQFTGKNLRILRAAFNSRMRLGSLPNLELLDLSRVTEQHGPEQWPDLIKLRNLNLVEAKLISLAGVERLPSLTHLEMYYLKRLESMNALQSLPLKTLEIGCCKKIRDLIPVIKSLKSLENLRLIDCGTLEDVNFVSDLNLKEFRFVDTKVLNGDLSALKQIPVVAFTDAKHYNARSKDFRIR
jgi:hypothetical protein